MRITRRHARLGVAATAAVAALSAVATPGTGPATAAPPPRGVDTTFGIAVIPDTQTEVTDPSDRRLVERMEWLVKNRNSLDLRHVGHVGDVVSWGWLDPAQYVVADSAYKVLDRAGIPYTLAAGNHDTHAVDVGGTGYAGTTACRTQFSVEDCEASALLRQTAEWNATFSPSRQGVTGTFEAGKAENSYKTLAAGGRNWLLLNVEQHPRFDVITWARTVVAYHPHHNVIVQTHSYLTGNGSIGTFGSTVALTSPQYLYDTLISRFSNIRIVLSGHTGDEAIRTDTGINGNKIVSLLTTFHDTTTNPVRLLTIDTAKNTLQTWVHRPQTNKSTSKTTVSGMNWVS